MNDLWPDGRAIERLRACLKLLAEAEIGSFLGQQVEASDIVQQTLLEAVARQDQFRGETTREWLAWVRRMLSHNIIDAARFHGRQKRDVGRVTSLDDLPIASQAASELAAHQSTPSQRAAVEEQLFRLPEALEQLPAAQCEALVGHYLQGLKLADISRRMNRSEAAVGGLLHRGLRRLCEILEGDQRGPT